MGKQHTEHTYVYIFSPIVPNFGLLCLHFILIHLNRILLPYYFYTYIMFLSVMIYIKNAGYKMTIKINTFMIYWVNTKRKQHNLNISKTSSSRYSEVPLIRPPVVLVVGGLNTELVSLTRPIYIENAFWYWNKLF